jgi:hypothetical protein
MVLLMQEKQAWQIEICKDFTGQEIGTVSKVPHETRNVQFKEKVEIKYKGKL